MLKLYSRHNKYFCYRRKWKILVGLHTHTCASACSLCLFLYISHTHTRFYGAFYFFQKTFLELV